MRHNSQITTNASGTATGGNINIEAGAVAALENSDIRANAIRGDAQRTHAAGTPPLCRVESSIKACTLGGITIGHFVRGLKEA